MNWMEGSLARHSRRKGWNPDADRQRRYFAKARARKHHGATTPSTIPPSSFVPDYIPKFYEAEPDHDGVSSASQSSAGPPKRPRSQNGGQEPAPSVFRDSISPRSNKLSSPQRRSNTNLDSKRRKLLEKSDWVGVNLQKPISVGPSSRRGSHAKLLPNCDPNLAQTHQYKISHGCRGRNRGNHSTNKHIKIRIGDDAFRWSEGSNSVRSPASHLDPLPAFEPRVFIQGGSAATQDSSFPSSRNIYSTHTSSLRDRNPPATYSNPWGSCQVPSSASNSGYSSDRCTGGHRGEPQDQPQYIVHSSPYFIHQPRPTLGRVADLFDLRSPSPVDTSSVVAQIGSLPFENAQAAADDQAWNIWLNPDDGYEQRNDSDAYGGNAPSPFITPGPSHCRDRLDAQSTAPHEGETGEEKDLQMGESELLLLAPPLMQMVPCWSPNSGLNQDEPGSPKLPQNQDGPISETSLETAPPKRKVSTICGGREKSINGNNKDLTLPSKTEAPSPLYTEDLLDLLIHEHGEAGSNDTLQHTSEDEDEVWKKFVLDGDATELRGRRGIEARHQTTHCPHLARADAHSAVAEPPASLRENPSRSPAPVTALDSNYSENSRSPKMVSHRADPTETVGTPLASSGTANIGSPRLQHSDFRFHQPQLFVGRLASLPSASVSHHPTQQQQQLDEEEACSRANKRGGRRGKRRRRSEGRPDFRAMPDYEDDPIEECSSG